MRSMLFVPGTRPDMMRKATSSAADAVCLDLEDSVPPSGKAAAREQIVQAFADLDFGVRVRILRINAVETPFAYRDLVDVVEPAGERIDLVMIPKTGSPRHVEFVDTLLSQISDSRGIRHRIGIEAQIETAAGFLHAGDIAAASSRLEALVFGAGDYAASMHMPSAGIGERDEHDAVYPGDRWHAVMHTIVAAARVNGMRCMDGPYGAYADAAGMERACRIARALGFDGKQCIHPSQVPIANAVFTPSDAEVAAAAGVVRAYEQAQAEGRGAASHDGRMIDAANLRMARTTVERRRLIDRT